MIVTTFQYYIQDIIALLFSDVYPKKRSERYDEMKAEKRDATTRNRTGDFQKTSTDALGIDHFLSSLGFASILLATEAAAGILALTDDSMISQC